MLGSLGGHLAECAYIISSLFFKFKVIRLVVFISPCAHLLINQFLYCAVLLNAKYALSDDIYGLLDECKWAYMVPCYN